MLEYYKSALQADASQETDEADKADLLEQQTLEAWTHWEQQQAAAYTCQLMLSLSLSPTISVTYYAVCQQSVAS